MTAVMTVVVVVATSTADYVQNWLVIDSCDCRLVANTLPTTIVPSLCGNLSQRRAKLVEDERPIGGGENSLGNWPLSVSARGNRHLEVITNAPPGISDVASLSSSGKALYGWGGFQLELRWRHRFNKKKMFGALGLSKCLVVKTTTGGGWRSD